MRNNRTRARSNSLPEIKASSMSPSNLSLHLGERPMVACPMCDRWRFIRRGMLAPHRADDGVSRCSGSDQKIRIDLTPEQWQTALREAELDAAGRRPSSVQRTGKPPTPAAVTQIAARGAA